MLITCRQKTVKSTAELEVELNATYAFDAITEAGSELQAVFGPGLTGLQNLGNSCYMNSIFQMLLSGTVPELARRFGCRAEAAGSSSASEVLTKNSFLKAVAPTSAPTDVLCQTAKLACALTSGVFAKPMAEGDTEASSDPMYRLAPRMMKHCIGKDHVDFRTTQQQDAAQFLQYFLERLDRAELGASSKAKVQFGSDPVRTSSHLFAFQTTARLVCAADSKIKYKQSASETIWSLRIPMDKARVIENEDLSSPEQKKLKQADDATDHLEKEPIRAISLLACFEEWANDTVVDGISWSHLGGANHPASQTLSLTNYPRYLIIQVQRYALGADWVPIKLEVHVEVPEELDLNHLKSNGPQDDEILVPDDSTPAESAAEASKPVIDEAAISQLMDMGFSLNSCKRALVAVGGSNVEAAMGWVFEHNVSIPLVCQSP
jgi:ubiquitin carboxyl-terminal hydrolase 5/13